ncbi:hypothetical protein [Actinacidiphila acididurans]|uniref:4Fe-4S Wbl-type domain-containing protein n=1 Tax=Actinacidiphila acididurans TaxID=2784346 RepID=A0ABS2U377_9ACTN|nr:hypothetical protein [Actinacidiphila acididurans]MBM9510047.1 hypothetical protein [Actinacidiphila acididurans]
MTTTTAAPYACRWCGIGEREHMQRSKPPVGWHPWQAPTQEQIKTRMLLRRAARLAERAARRQALFHATGFWTGSSLSPEDEGEFICRDCGSPACARLARVQRHLDRIRWPQSWREPFLF